MGDVVKIRPADDPDVVLVEAQGNYQDVIVMGYDKNGELDVRASLGLDAKSALFMVEQFKNSLMNGDYATEDGY